MLPCRRCVQNVVKTGLQKTQNRPNYLVVGPWKYQIYNHYRLTWTLPPWSRNVTQYSKLLLILNTFELQFKRSSNQCSPSRQPSVWITQLQYNLIDLIQQRGAQALSSSGSVLSPCQYCWVYISIHWFASSAVAQWLSIVPLWFAVFIQGSSVLPVWSWEIGRASCRERVLRLV